MAKTIKSPEPEIKVESPTAQVALEAAKAAIEADRKARAEAFLAEVNAAAQKHRCRVSPKLIYAGGALVEVGVEVIPE